MYLDCKNRNNIIPPLVAWQILSDLVVLAPSSLNKNTASCLLCQLYETDPMHVLPPEASSQSSESLLINSLNHILQLELPVQQDILQPLIYLFNEKKIIIIFDRP